MLLFLFCGIAAISTLLFLFEVSDDLFDRKERKEIEEHDVLLQSPPTED